MAYFAIVYQSSEKTKSKIQLLFSYSEWWRYIGSVKPRQPPDRIVCTGRCQPERNFRTIRGFEHYYSGPLKIADLFLTKKVFRESQSPRTKSKREEKKKMEKNEWKK